MKEQELWLSDGTFISCPKILSQLWVIYGEVEERVFPLVYCLISNDDRPAYFRTLKVINKIVIKIIEEIQGREP